MNDVRELNRVLETGNPVVLFLPTTFDPAELERAGLAVPPDRTRMVRANRTQAFPVLTFHGADDTAGLSGILEDASRSVGR